MTSQLMEWRSVALMNEGGKGGGEECEVRRLVREASAPRKEKQESCQFWGRSISLESRQKLREFWRMVHLLP